LGHIVELVQKLDDRDLRALVCRTRRGWSRAQLQTAIATGLHERQGAAIANFEWTLEIALS
jgi:predicted nuclease of restriction endonuclease-like (RecB) superfamily